MSQNPIFNPREEAVIDHLMQGESNKQIALALGVSTRTVKFHLGKVYAKLGVASRGEAILKLSAPPFAESTAEAHSSEWRQSTVDSTHPASENQNEKPTFTWRVPMKKYRFLWGGLLALLVIAFIIVDKPFQDKGSNQSVATGLPIAASSITPAITPLLSARSQIVAEIQQLAAQYDQAVTSAIQNGEAETSKDASSGKEIIRFSGDSYLAIHALYEALATQMLTLNEKYLALYLADVQPTPFPTQVTEAQNDTYYQQLLQQYPAYFDQVLKDGPTVRVYDPDEGSYFDRVIGDAYAKGELMASAMQTLQDAPQLALIDQNAFMDKIRQTLGDPNLELIFQGISQLANAQGIRAATYTDAAGNTYSVAISAKLLVGIDPALTNRVNVPAAEVKSIAEVRPLAEEFASSSSPRFAGLKEDLLYEESSKRDIYFFRWDYRNKDWSGTPWALMPPFLQVGLSADGKLVTYINTLDLY